MAKIGYPAALIEDGTKRLVEAGPTLGLDLFPKGVADLRLAPRPQFQRDPIRCAAPEASADVVAADDQVLPVVGAARTSTWMWGLSVFQ